MALNDLKRLAGIKKILVEDARYEMAMAGLPNAIRDNPEVQSALNGIIRAQQYKDAFQMGEGVQNLLRAIAQAYRTASQQQPNPMNQPRR